MLLGYNTNGLAHHRLLDALDLLTAEGYQSVAITLDVGALDPFARPDVFDREAFAVRGRLDDLGLRRVIETGARYLLNPRKKHDPTLLDPNPARVGLRVEFLKRAIDLAHVFEADAVSLWSGAVPDAVSDEAAMERLVTGLREVIAHAEAKGMVLAFEPEPGMFIDTFERFAALDARINHPLFQLTVDVGHVHCLEAGKVADHLIRWAPRIRNIHIEDMQRGVHEHLMFGEGTIDFAGVCGALAESGYAGGIHVELSRHSHMAVEAVRKSRDFLVPLLESGSGSRLSL